MRVLDYARLLSISSYVPGIDISNASGYRYRFVEWTYPLAGTFYHTGNETTALKPSGTVSGARTILLGKSTSTRVEQVFVLRGSTRNSNEKTVLGISIFVCKTSHKRPAPATHPSHKTDFLVLVLVLECWLNERGCGAFDKPWPASWLLIKSTARAHIQL